MISEIDIGDLLPSGFRAMPDAVRAVIPDIAESVRSEIIRLAGEKLRTSYDDYTQGVQPVKYHMPTGIAILTAGATVASITLVGQLPNMIEKGWAGGDMKPWLLRGRAAREGKDGNRYVNVPFRHGAPGQGAAERNFLKMGEAHVRAGQMTRAEGRKLGRAIHHAAKRLGPGERLPEGMSPRLRGHHKTDIYAGMIRQEHTYARATQAQYRTWRRVSLNSDPQSWEHPGINAVRIFDEASAYGSKVAAHLIGMAMKGVSEGGP